MHYQSKQKMDEKTKEKVEKVINSDKVFEELSNKRLILREMKQYKIPNALRLTIGDEQANEHFIKSIGKILR